MKDYVEMRNGGYYIAGKRVSLDSIVYAFREGRSAEGIQQSYPTLTLEEVYGGIAFYLANQAAVDKAIVEEEAEFEKFHQESLIRNADLHAKLDQARADLEVRVR